MRFPVSLLCWLAPGLALAQSEVISPRPDSVSVTIYRDLFALITETRTVDLPSDAVTLSFDGVVDSLIPASAVVAQLDRRLEERNYDYAALAPANLLRRSVGRNVILTRTLPGSGRVSRTAATIVAATDDGVTLRTADGQEALSCSGLPEGLSFEEIPGDLHPTPRLSVRLAAGAAGRRVIKLSYIAQGFAWKSDYVAQLAENGRSMDLTGWVTLRNHTRASLRDAEVQVVAGRLNLLYDEKGGSSTVGDTADFESEQELQEARDQRLMEITEETADALQDLAFLHGCYPFGAPRPVEDRDRFERQQRYGSFSGVLANYYGDGDLDEIVVTGMRRSIAAPEMLADYHLYRIPWRTDLNSRQTKQVVFLQKDAVKTERFYGLRIDPTEMDEDEPQRPRVLLGFENRKSNGLGEPLPGGMFRLFEAGQAGPVFAGETLMGDKAVGLPVELSVAGAMDLSVELSVEDVEGSGEDEGDIVVRAYNAKAWPVLLEVRQPANDLEMAYRVSRSSHRPGRKFGDLMWRVTVPANAVGELRYRLRAEDTDQDTGD